MKKFQLKVRIFRKELFNRNKILCETNITLANLANTNFEINDSFNLIRNRNRILGETNITLANLENTNFEINDWFNLIGNKVRV